MSTTTTTLAIPGQLLGSTSKYQPGPGTHIHESNLYASLLGSVRIVHPAAAPTTKPTGPVKRLTKLSALTNQSSSSSSSLKKQSSSPDQLPTISVTVSAEDNHHNKKREILPEVGNVVLCKVIRITPRQAVVSILVCGDTVLEAEWQGLIRVQDVRATEKDRVKVYESFRPGDVVRAEVISLGDQANYYLATSKNELGVILATSEAGNTMHPISWKEYRDPVTGLTELRKVAKPY
ncbi:putative exoribonuclease CSL4 [Podospora fimiseda]|uniref:Exoribonuclease CSL4 n=1 Tax=Podospora fimiseda TaxID=252190 RepID=A0AAN7GVX7_9PEZI|nr:putative exoribonuclease CSL4 [Podospora fimiseda]